MYVRPGLRQFLLEISKYFEIVLFSNGSQLYTNAVVERLLEKINAKDEFNVFDHILSREQCSTNDKSHEIKDLDFFTGRESGRDLKDCIIVDNSVLCFQNHLTNGLFIPNFNFMDVNDDWLKYLSKYLIERFIEPNEKGEQTNFTDVRTLIGQDLRLKEIFNMSDVSQIR